MPTSTKAGPYVDDAGGEEHCRGHGQEAVQPQPRPVTKLAVDSESVMGAESRRSTAATAVSVVAVHVEAGVRGCSKSTAATWRGPPC